VLLKDSSLGFIVGYPELLKAMQNNAQYFGQKYYVALFLVGAGIYLVVNISLTRLAVWLQGRSNRTAGKAVADPTLVTMTAGGPGNPAAGGGIA
jgi:glutamate transport system permease protein